MGVNRKMGEEGDAERWGDAAKRRCGEGEMRRKGDAEREMGTARVIKRERRRRCDPEPMVALWLPWELSEMKNINSKGVSSMDQ
jgi:hypothetical protein